MDMGARKTIQYSSWDIHVPSNFSATGLALRVDRDSASCAFKPRHRFLGPLPVRAGTDYRGSAERVSDTAQSLRALEWLAETVGSKNYSTLTFLKGRKKWRLKYRSRSSENQSLMQ